MKVTPIEAIGTFFLVAGLAIDPDYNTGINLLAMAICFSLGALCFVLNKLRRR